MNESEDVKRYDCVAFNSNKSWTKWKPYVVNKNFDDALNHKWITETLYLHCPNIISLFPKSTFQILKVLTLGEQTLSYDEFQTITSGKLIETYTSYNIKVLHTNGNSATLEEIFLCLPMAKVIWIQDNVPTINSIDALKAIHLPSLKEIHISQIHDGYDLNVLSEYMKANQNVNFRLHFSKELSNEYQKNSRNFLINIIQSWGADFKPPSSNIFDTKLSLSSKKKGKKNKRKNSSSSSDSD